MFQRFYYYNQQMKGRGIRQTPQEDMQDYYDPEDQQLEPMRINSKDDRQIEQMIGEMPSKRSNDFQMTGRYSGKKAEEHEGDRAGEEQDGEDQSIEEQRQTRELRSLGRIDTKLLEDKMKEIDQQDQEFVQTKAGVEHDPNQSQALKNQLNFYQRLLQIRYHFERNFQEIKKFPYKVIPCNQGLNQSAKEAELSTIKTIDSLFEVQKHLYQSTFNEQIPAFSIVSTLGFEARSVTSEQEYLTQKKLSVEALYTHYQKVSGLWTKNTQESLIKWSNKTALLTQSRSNFQSLIMQTPVGQAQKIFGALDKIINKARLKRNTFKILFEETQNIKETSNPQIFDDFDFFCQLSKAYQTKVDKEDQDGLLMGDTRKFLQERNNRDHQDRKQVDRRASKNRKIRYNVHAKLLNFTAARENPHTLEARDEIVRNIFNSAPKQDQVDYLEF